STGNVVDLATALDTYGGMPLRLLFLRAHYRAPIEYSADLVEEAAEAYRRIGRLLERVPPADVQPDAGVLDAFREAMDDDFGTPEAVAVLFDTIRDANRRLDDGGEADGLVAAVREIVTVRGLDAGDSSGGLDAEAIRAVAAEFGVEVGGDIEAAIDERPSVREI